LVAFSFVLIGTTVEAGTVTIAWDPSPDANITNYSVFVGTRSGSYTSAVAVGMRTTWTFTNLVDNQTYVFAVQAQSSLGGSPFAEISYRTPVLPTPGSEATRSDFNRDGNYDLLWQTTVSGQLATWAMNGASLVDSRYLSPDRVSDLAWKIKGSADFNKDGKPDLLWQNDTTGQLAVWYLDGTLLYLSGAISPDRPGDPNWKVAAVRDFNWDGSPDLIFRHKTTGQIAIWFLNGTTSYSQQLLGIPQVADLNWQIMGSGDLNGDGGTDLVWQNIATGDLAAWYLWGANVIGTVSLSPARVGDPKWRVVSVVDVDKNGKLDLIWRHETNGGLAVWYMNGAALTGSGMLNPSAVSDSTWKIVGPR
jgi:hypothetical protein